MNLTREIMPPVVSVIMPLHNASPYLEDAANSILRQTFRDFELVMLDDGSSDDTAACARDIAARDNRVRFLARERRGLSRSLNDLIDHAEGRYIARMDGDDIAHSERLARQVAHLDLNPTTGVLGCWVQTFGDRSEIWHFRRWSNFTRNLMFFGVTTLCHPSWMVRRELYEKHNYDPDFDHIEDREWLARVAAREPDIDFVSLPEVLLNYRLHPASITGRHATFQQQKTRDIVATLLKAHGIRLGNPELNLYMKACFAEATSHSELRQIGEILERVRDAVADRVPDQFKVFREFWLKLCHRNDCESGLIDAFLQTDDFCFISEKPARLRIRL